MQPNLIILNNEVTIEHKLLHMQHLDTQIKALEAEFKMLKEEVVEKFFIPTKASEYKTAKGLVLAQYIRYMEKRFNGKKFELDFPDIYAGYKEEKEVCKFLLK